MYTLHALLLVLYFECSEVLWSNPLNSRKWPTGFRLVTRITVWKLTGADRVVSSSAPPLTPVPLHCTPPSAHCLMFEVEVKRQVRVTAVICSM